MTTRRDFLRGSAAAATGIVFWQLWHAARCTGASLSPEDFRSWSRASGSGPSTCTPIASSPKPASCSARRRRIRSGAATKSSSISTSDWPRWIRRRSIWSAVDQSELVQERSRTGRPRWSSCKTKNSPSSALQNPTAFAAFASLTLQAARSGGAELETAVRKQGLKGAAIGGKRRRRGVLRSEIFPGLGQAEQLGASLFIHPQGVPELNKQLAGNGWLTNAIAYPVETTIALSHLIFEGTFDKFPGLKVIAAHGGGFLPSYAARSDHACLVNPGGCNPDIKLKKQPTRIPQADLFRFTGIHARSAAPSRSTSRRRPDRARQRLSFPWQLQPVDHIFCVGVVQR